MKTNKTTKLVILRRDLAFALNFSSNKMTKVFNKCENTLEIEHMHTPHIDDHWGGTRMDENATKKKKNLYRELRVWGILEYVTLFFYPSE